jgi:hypothetical protein
MRYAFYALLLCFHGAFGQSDSTVYVKELAWTIKLPPGFKVIDTATLNAESRARESEIHWIKKPKGPNYHKLVFWARNNAGEVIFVNFIDSVHDTLGLNFENIKFPSAGESNESEVIYDGVKFHKLRTKMNTNLYPYTSTTLKTAYDGKVFTIEYAVSDSTLEDEIESMLKASKFDR